MYKVLVVSNNPFYGGGEAFIVSTLLPLQDTFKMLFLVRNAELSDQLPEKTLLESNTLVGQRSELSACLRKFQPDLVVYNGGSTLFLSLCFSAPSLLIRHTTDDCVEGSLRRFFYKIGLHSAFALSHHTVHVSAYSATQQHIARNRMTVIHNGGIKRPDRASWYDGQRPLRALYCGRLVRGKGLHLLIDAFKTNYFESGMHAELTVVGTGPLMTELKERATCNVRFVGYQSDVTPFYREADVYMQLSRFENCPLSVIDALHFSMPVIATKVGGLPELVKDPYNGFLVNQRLMSVNLALRSLINHPELVAQMGENSRKMGQEAFSVNTAIEEYKNLINQIIENS